MRYYSSKSKQSGLQAKMSQKILKRSLHSNQRGKIHQEDITIFSIYIVNMGEPDFIKQTLLDVKAD